MKTKLIILILPLFATLASCTFDVPTGGGYVGGPVQQYGGPMPMPEPGFNPGDGYCPEGRPPRQGYYGGPVLQRHGNPSDVQSWTNDGIHNPWVQPRITYQGCP